LKELPRVHLILDAGRCGDARLASARAGGKIRGSRMCRERQPIIYKILTI